MILVASILALLGWICLVLSSPRTARLLGWKRPGPPFAGVCGVLLLLGGLGLAVARWGLEVGLTVGLLVGSVSAILLVAAANLAAWRHHGKQD